MVRRLFEFTGRLCLALLLLCMIFQAMFLAMAYAAEKLTEPPACQVVNAFPMPFAECPGFNLGSTVEYMMVLPGAVLALPLLLPVMLNDASFATQPFIVAPILVHVFAWGYLIVSLYNRFRARRRRVA